jgi:hypothetical protein
MNRILSLLPSALAISLAVGSATAQNANYAPGDLILYFQQEGGTNTVYANLGNTATQFRGAAAGPGAPNKIDFLNISSQLASAFGAGWASDPTVYAGLAGVWGTSNTNISLNNGDPHRTLYVSASRNGVGSVGAGNSTVWDMVLAGNTAMDAGASNIKAQNDRLEILYDTAVAVSPKGDSFIDEQNPFLSAGVQNNAFNAFAGGVQQVGSASTFGSFGDAGTVEFALDLYRILARNTIANQVAGDLRIGSYEGTVTVNSSGLVSFISQGSAAISAYDDWMQDFTSITLDEDKQADADPDGDGANNTQEFAFGGDPGSPLDHGLRLTRTVDADGNLTKDFTLTLEVRDGATFTSDGNGKLVSNTVDEISYRIEGSTDLLNWNSPVSEVSPLGSGSPKTGYVFKTFRLNVGSGLAGKGFIRAFVSK